MSGSTDGDVRCHTLPALEEALWLKAAHPKTTFLAQAKPPNIRATFSVGRASQEEGAVAI